jgi:hypothetical protein
MFARMSSGREVMTGLDNVAAELFIFRNIEFSFVINGFVLLFPFKEAVDELTRPFGFERLKSLSYRGFVI